MKSRRIIFSVALIFIIIIGSISVQGEEAYSIQWQKAFGGSDNTNFKEVISTEDGGVVVIGYTDCADGDIKTKVKEQPEGSAFKEFQDLLIVKFDSSGKEEWHRTYGGSGTEYGYSIKTLENGNFIVAGMANAKDKDVVSNSVNSVKKGVWIVSISSTGDLLWEKVIKDIEYTINSVEKMVLTDDAIILGAQGSSGSFYAPYLIKLDLKGNLQWQLKVPGFYIHDIALLEDNTVLTAGNYLVKYNQEGEVLWQVEADQANQRVTGTKDGGFLWGIELYKNKEDILNTYQSVALETLVTSSNESDMDLLIVKFSEAGKALWANYIGGTRNENIGDIKETTTGYLIGGSSQSSDGDVTENKGSTDFWLAELSEEGNLLWQKTLGGNKGDNLESLAIVEDGIVATGFTNSADGDVSGLHNPTKMYSYDAWIVKVSKSEESNNSNIQVSQGNYPSSWAKEYVDTAKSLGLTSNNLLGNYQGRMTRKDFCELIVRLYEVRTGYTAVLPEVNPFTDTNDQYVQKAYHLGLVGGVGNDKFDPDASLTREQTATIFYRLMTKIKPGLDTDISYIANFADQSEVSSWASEALTYTNYRGIFTGVGNNRIDPKGIITREQAIILSTRIYDKIDEYVLDAFHFNHASPLYVTAGSKTTLTITVEGKDFSSSEKCPSWQIDNYNVADISGSIIGGASSHTAGELDYKFIITSDYKIIVDAKQKGKTTLTATIGARENRQSLTIDIIVQ